MSEALLPRRVLAEETHGQTLRVAPPLVIDEPDLYWAIDQISETITALR